MQSVWQVVARVITQARRGKEIQPHDQVHKWLRAEGAPGWLASSHVRTASTLHSHLPSSVIAMGDELSALATS